MKLNGTYLTLFIIFLLALIIRFIYFPGNTYVAYDTARDALTSIELIKGDLKIVGPYSSFNNFLHHGPLVYYLWVPILFIFNNSPEALSAFTRIYNALGIIFIFIIGKELFNKRVGIIAALLFAFSYEQSQYALFLNHPTYAVLPILIFYIGLIQLFFKQNPIGLIIAALGLGFAIQFHYVHSYLFLIFIICTFFFRKNLPSFKPKVLILSFFTLILILSSFIMAEFKYNFPLSQATTSIFEHQSNTNTPIVYPKAALTTFYRFLSDNFVNNSLAVSILMLYFLSFYTLLIRKNEYRQKLTFLSLIFLSGGLIYLISGSNVYYYNAGSSVSILIFTALTLSLILQKFKIIGLTLIFLVIISNSLHIINENNLGPNQYIFIQPQMITQYQKQAIEYMYEESQGQPFAINGITIPLYINTTWSYLFEWYGKSNYSYLPVWGGSNAMGYPGNLEVLEARSKLPKTRFLIIEPQKGINHHHYLQFIIEENYFSRIIEEKVFGTIIVQKREGMN